MIQQRLLPEAGGAGVEERSARLADGEFDRCGASLALLAGSKDLVERFNCHRSATEISRPVRKF